METIRVNVLYRPLRVCWAIKSGDIEGFRKAVRLSHTMWGGRYNPIVFVDREAEAKRLVEAFRVDVILPLGDSEEVKNFVAQYPHLIKPFYSDSIFVGNGQGNFQTQILDIHNALLYLRETPIWNELTEQGVRLYNWKIDDPLADAFLMQFGAYPLGDDCPIDYTQMLKDAGLAREVDIDLHKILPADIFDHRSVTFLSRYGLNRHYSIRSEWDYPGFYVGD
jgi:hypothetical protein